MSKIIVMFCAFFLPIRLPFSVLIQELLISEEDYIQDLQFLQTHHLKFTKTCPNVPGAVASQKSTIFRNIEDIARFHSRWAFPRAFI